MKPLLGSGRFSLRLVFERVRSQAAIRPPNEPVLLRLGRRAAAVDRLTRGSQDKDAKY